MLTINHVMIFLSLSFLHLFAMVYTVYLAVCFLFRCYGALQLISCRHAWTIHLAFQRYRYNTHHCPVTDGY